MSPSRWARDYNMPFRLVLPSGLDVGAEPSASGEGVGSEGSTQALSVSSELQAADQMALMLLQ